MKKLIVLFCALLLVGCGSTVQPQETTTAVTELPIETTQALTEPQLDVDLTTLSSTMVYSEVFAMMTQPSDYLGKTVKMRGNFSIYTDPASGKNYYACLIADATACCSQGLEFILSGEHTYPQDYPAPASEITVVGTFDTYEENGNNFCQLIDAQLLDSTPPQPAVPE